MDESGELLAHRAAGRTVAFRAAPPDQATLQFLLGRVEQLEAELAAGPSQLAAGPSQLAAGPSQLEHEPAVGGRKAPGGEGGGPVLRGLELLASMMQTDAQMIAQLSGIASQQEPPDPLVHRAMEQAVQALDGRRQSMQASAVRQLQQILRRGERRTAERGLERWRQRAAGEAVRSCWTAFKSEHGRQLAGLEAQNQRLGSAAERADIEHQQELAGAMRQVKQQSGLGVMRRVVWALRQAELDRGFNRLRAGWAGARAEAGVQGLHAHRVQLELRAVADKAGLGLLNHVLRRWRQSKLTRLVSEWGAGSIRAKSLGQMNSAHSAALMAGLAEASKSGAVGVLRHVVGAWIGARLARSVHSIKLGWAEARAQAESHRRSGSIASAMSQAMQQAKQQSGLGVMRRVVWALRQAELDRGFNRLRAGWAGARAEAGVQGLHAHRVQLELRSETDVRLRQLAVGQWRRTLARLAERQARRALSSWQTAALNPVLAHRAAGRTVAFRAAPPDQATLQFLLGRVEQLEAELAAGPSQLAAGPSQLELAAALQRTRVIESQMRELEHTCRSREAEWAGSAQASERHIEQLRAKLEVRGSDQVVRLLSTDLAAAVVMLREVTKARDRAENELRRQLGSVAPVSPELRQQLELESAFKEVDQLGARSRRASPSSPRPHTKLISPLARRLLEADL